MQRQIPLSLELVYSPLRQTVAEYNDAHLLTYSANGSFRLEEQVAKLARAVSAALWPVSQWTMA